MSNEIVKSNSAGKCPIMHGGITKAGESNTSRLWPNSINLDTVSYTHLTLPTTPYV